MSKPRIKLLVLDAQGVVLNAPLGGFLDELARRTGQSAATVREEWQRRSRIPAWTGAISDEELWKNLSPGGYDFDPLALFESTFSSGPAAPHLPEWRRHVSIWLLSNHRSHWLLPRLDRFGLAVCFDRILVSDELGAVKPDAAAFAPVLEHVQDPSHALFVDDLKRNVEAASALGITALHAGPASRWITRTDKMLRQEEHAPRRHSGHEETEPTRDSS